jgi:hypothetical protein
LCQRGSRSGILDRRFDQQENPEQENGGADSVVSFPDLMAEIEMMMIKPKAARSGNLLLEVDTQKT